MRPLTDTQQGPRAVASEPPSKECEKSLVFEEHEPHHWYKKRDVYKRFPFHCDGVLPIDEQPPCQIFVSPERPVCGEPSPSTVHVKTQLIDAMVDVCKLHKHEYNHQAAARRQARETRKSA